VRRLRSPSRSRTSVCLNAIPRSRPSCFSVRRSVSDFRRSSYCLAGSILRTAAQKRRRNAGSVGEGLRVFGGVGRPGSVPVRNQDHAFKSLSRLERRVTDVADVTGLARLGPDAGHRHCGVILISAVDAGREKPGSDDTAVSARHRFLVLLAARLRFRGPASLASSRQRSAAFCSICFAVLSRKSSANSLATFARSR